VLKFETLCSAIATRGVSVPHPMPGIGSYGVRSKASLLPASDGADAGRAPYFLD